MELVEAFVEFKASTKNIDAATKSIKGQLKGLEGNFSALQAFATKAFLGLAAAGIYAAKAFGDAEAEEVKLKSALRSNYELTVANTGAAKDHAAAMGGMEAAVEGTFQSLNKFAQAMQLLTVYDDDAVKGVMALASNLGVANKDLEQVTRTGIGLAQRYFGGDLKAGVEAASKAYNGNTKALDKIIPGLKQVTSAQGKWNEIQKQGAVGFKQAEDRTHSFNGAMLQLWGQINNVAENMGGVLAPTILKITAYLNALAQKLQTLSPAMTENIVKWGGIALGIAAVIAFGPQIVAFGTIVSKVFLTFAKVAITAITAIVRAFVQGVIFMVTTPIGLLLTGLAAIATGFAYLIGSGDNFTDRTISGFVKIANFLDTLLGSWQGFKEGVMLIGSQLWSYLLEGFYYWKTALIDGWEYMAGAIETAWWDAFRSMYGAWEVMKSGAQKFINWFKASWENMIDAIADKFDTVLIQSQAESDVRRKNAGKGLSQSDMQKKIDEETNFRLSQQTSLEKQRDSKKNSAYQGKQNELDASAKFNVAQIGANVDSEKNKAAQARATARAKNNEAGDNALAEIEIERRKRLESDLAAMAKMPKLSDKVKKAYEMIREGMGVDKVSGYIDSIKNEINGIRGEADKAAADAESKYGVGNKGNSKTGLLGKVGQSIGDGAGGGKSIEAAFKENLTKKLLGATRINREQEEKKKAEASAKKEELAQRAATNALIKHIDATNGLKGATEKLTEKILEKLNGNPFGGGNFGLA